MQARSNQVLANYLNALTGNYVPKQWRHAESGTFKTYKLTPTGADIRTPGALITALREELGAEVDMQVVSRITTFGMGAKLC